MTSRAGKKHKLKATDRSTDWSDWILDESNSQYCRARTDADGNYVYETIPIDTSSQQSPQSQSGSTIHSPYASNTTTAQTPYYGAFPYDYPPLEQNESSVETLSNTIESLKIAPTDTPVVSHFASYNNNPELSQSSGDNTAQPIPVPPSLSRSFPYNVRYSASAPAGGYMNIIAGKATNTSTGYYAEDSFGYYPEGPETDPLPPSAYQRTQAESRNVYGTPSEVNISSRAYQEPGSSSQQPASAVEASGSGIATPKGSHMRIKGTSGKQETLDPRFKIHNSKYFKPGHVFKVLWSEPRGETSSNATDVTTFTLGKTTFGEKVQSSIRRFVIVAADKGHCQCLPILTYQYQGATKFGVKRDDHAIVYIGKNPPEEVHGERLSKRPIEVIPKSARDKLEPESRINYAKIYTVEHNVKVCFIGNIARSSEKRFMTDFDATWNNKLQMSQDYSYY